MTWGLRAFSIGLLLFSLVFCVHFWGGAITGKRQASLQETLLPLVFLVTSCVLVAQAFRNYVALTQNEIVLQTLFTRRTLPLDKIRGRRRHLVRSGDETPDAWHLKLEPIDDRFPELDFEEKQYALDDYFHAWFAALRDLDEIDQRGIKTSRFGLV
jgi:hypothetical protein